MFNFQNNVFFLYIFFFFFCEKFWPYEEPFFFSAVLLRQKNVTNLAQRSNKLKCLVGLSLVSSLYSHWKYIFKLIADISIMRMVSYTWLGRKGKTQIWAVTKIAKIQNFFELKCCFLHKNLSPKFCMNSIFVVSIGSYILLYWQKYFSMHFHNSTDLFHTKKRKMMLVENE